MFTKYLIAICIFFTTAMTYADVVVVVNKNNANPLTKQIVSRIFLGKEKKFPDGSETISINQATGSAERDEFNEKVLGRSSSQVTAYWSRLVFTGKGIPPKEVSSSAEVLELISKNESAIGYVNKADVTDAVKVINF